MPEQRDVVLERRGLALKLIHDWRRIVTVARLLENGREASQLRRCCRSRGPSSVPSGAGCMLHIAVRPDYCEGFLTDAARSLLGSSISPRGSVVLASRCPLSVRRRSSS